ncbi:MAG TPA: lysophospholipid acyltransferase family protein [Burkholderiaceae bacterium]|nr:lysophospholipid acyltransferase family protein [Burkholderiaceae bacterium]
MRALRAVWRLAGASLHLGHGIAVMALRFPFLDAGGRARCVQWWSATLLRRLGLHWHCDGTPRPGATLIVANHISWLDIAAIHAACPQARFVSKADVKRWPLIGWLVGAAGTLFIERERKRDALRVVHQMAEALRAGQTVAVFPEGTTSEGHGTLPFHANLLQAAIAAEAPVQPVALRFSDRRHAVSPSAMFVGETTLMQSVWAIACADGLRVQVTLLPPLASAHADRRALAERLRGEIGAVLSGSAGAGPPQGG